MFSNTFNKFFKFPEVSSSKVGKCFVVRIADNWLIKNAERVMVVDPSISLTNKNPVAISMSGAKNYVLCSDKEKIAIRKDLIFEAVVENEIFKVVLMPTLYEIFFDRVSLKVICFFGFCKSTGTIGLFNIGEELNFGMDFDFVNIDVYFDMFGKYANAPRFKQSMDDSDAIYRPSSPNDLYDEKQFNKDFEETFGKKDAKVDVKESEHVAPTDVNQSKTPILGRVSKLTEEKEKIKKENEQMINEEIARNASKNEKFEMVLDFRQLQNVVVAMPNENTEYMMKLRARAESRRISDERFKGTAGKSGSFNIPSKNQRMIQGEDPVNKPHVRYE